MSEAVLGLVLLSELKTLRIQCNSCGSAVELPIDQLTAQGMTCKLCSVPIGVQEFVDGLKQLSIGLRKVEASLVKGKASVAFVVPKTIE